MSRRKNTVDYNQPGYAGDAMSLGAVRAYREGAMPISRWTKGALVNRIVELGGSASCELFTLKQLQEGFLKHHSWHHTGVYANETSFYCVDESKARLCTEEVIREQFGDEKVNRILKRLANSERPATSNQKHHVKDTWVYFNELPEHRVEFLRISKSGNRMVRVHFINNKGEEIYVDDVDHHLWGELFRIPYEEYIASKGDSGEQK